ncbi:hypothetical protein N7462_010009 [Penicillium macrosclerotiorum]|uniref:uncharacterized protein n=1 Tax=Penicillium macrosclerotiorum TaxID=303699 RepID=UPI0025473CF3|nr:uncharacterized protein N7462_010009 [Penicillium macrosclerotiorum]KAJ5668939.1 hypothetical protein N7462_010009 [Penicillium macrosclerotiorum]
MALGAGYRVSTTWGSPMSMLGNVVILLLIGVGCGALHRIYFHPLAKQPGPLLARLSSIPNWYHAKKGDRHVWLYRLHTEYGSVVRFTPNSLSFNTVTAMDSIYKSRKANLIKSDWYQCVRDSAGKFESTFTARQKTRHAVKRRLLSHAFSDKALKDYEPRICALIDKWVEAIDAEAKYDQGMVDLGQWSGYLIFDVLGDLGFGNAFGFMANQVDRSLIGLVAKATGVWYSIGYHPFTKWVRYILFETRFGHLVGARTIEDNSRFRSFCMEKLMKRRKSQVMTEGIFGKEVKDDMFGHLLAGRDPETGEAYTVGDLACESVLLMVAGSQSTAGGLAATFFYLSHYPNKLARLRKELHCAFASEAAIRYDPAGTLATLPFLRACINESLRLSPPTPGHLPREIVGDDGMVIDGWWLPPGTNVGVSPYTIHHNAQYFRDPFDFQPERWLTDKEDDGAEQLASAFAPFSAGMTGCIGRQLAMMELCLTVARFLWRFDLRVQPGSATLPIEYELKDSFIGEGSGPRVQLIPCSP